MPYLHADRLDFEVTNSIERGDEWHHIARPAVTAARLLHLVEKYSGVTSRKWEKFFETEALQWHEPTVTNGDSIAHLHKFERETTYGVTLRPDRLEWDGNTIINFASSAFDK